MNPLNTIKGTLIAGVILSVVLTVFVKLLAAGNSPAQAPAVVELPAPDLGPSTQDEMSAPSEEIGPGEEVITE